MDDEIRSFQHDIDLISYAKSEGYTLNEGRSCERTKVLRNAVSADEIHVSRTSSGRWQYISFKDDSHKGDIVQFVRNLHEISLGKARVLLRQASHRSPPETFEPPPPPVERLARAEIQRTIQTANKAVSHPYLEERALNPYVLSSPRFADSWRVQNRDGFSNLIFPHRDRNGTCGYELKNKGFTGFCKEGRRGLWFSGLSKADNRLVVAESAIDAISYHQMYPYEKTRYASTGGGWSEKASDLLAGAIQKLPPKSHIVAAFDKDSQGEKYHEKLEKLAKAAPHVTYERRRPKFGKDWNDQLQELRKRHLARGLRKLEISR